MEFESVVSEIECRASEVLRLCKESRLKIVTVESCTGGLVSACLTDLPGSSEVLDRGYVAYSNDAKVDMLGIDRNFLHKYGAISEEVGVELAKAAFKKAPKCKISIAVVGITDSSIEKKTPGLIHICSACNDGAVLKDKLEVHYEDRKMNKYLATKACLDLLIQMIKLVSDELHSADPKSLTIQSQTGGCDNLRCECDEVCECIDCQCGKDNEEIELIMENLPSAPYSISSTSTEFSSIASSKGPSSFVDEEVKDDSSQRSRPRSLPDQYATHWPSDNEETQVAGTTTSHPGESYMFYNAMDDDNKRAMDILASEGPEAAMRFMFTDPNTGKSCNYADMRSRFG